MPRTNFFNKQAVSPVIASILLLAVTVIIGVGTFQFVQDYTKNTQQLVTSNAILDGLNTKVVDANEDRAYIQTPYDNLNISRVILDGFECTNNSGVSNSRVIELNLSSCSGNVTSFRPQLTIETNEGILQLQVRELRAVSSSSSGGGGGGSPSPTLNFSSNATNIAFEGDVNLTWSSTNSNNCTATGDWNGSKGTSGSEVRSSLSTSQTYTLECSGNGGSTTENVTITVGSQDTTPDAFSFTNQSGVATSTLITSNSVTPTGYDGPLTATVTGDGSPQISVNGGSWNTSANMSPSDSIELRLTSSSSGSTQFNATLNLGSYSTIWSVETQAAAPSLCSSLPGNWSEVPGNAYFSTSDFCVMEFEAKDVGGVATSQPSLTPWVIINFTDARAACNQLNTEHSSFSGTFRMITNREWMTIARNAEQQDTNWADGVVGSNVSSGGGLKRGNVRQLDSVSYDGASPADRSLDTNTKAMLTLSNGETIWDLSGNVWEWVDMLEDGSDFNGNACSGGDTWYSYFGNDGDSECTFNAPFSKDSAANTRYEMGPLGDYNADNGVGRIYSDSANGRALFRGGGWSNDANAGAFSAFLSYDPSWTGLSANLGFRCSYEP